MPSTANSHSRSSISAYSSPPTNTSASRGSTAQREDADNPEAHDEREAAEQGAAAARAAVDIAGKATTTTNCGRNSIALVRIRPPA